MKWLSKLTSSPNFLNGAVVLLIFSTFAFTIIFGLTQPYKPQVLGKNTVIKEAEATNTASEAETNSSTFANELTQTSLPDKSQNYLPSDDWSTFADDFGSVFRR